jgi:hypothetical protein
MRRFVNGVVAVVFVSSLAFVGACKKEANCANVTDHMMDLAMKDKDAAKEMKDMKADDKKKMKEEAVKKCNDEKPDKKVLECMMKAGKLEDTEKCEDLAKKKDDKDGDKK